MLAPNVNQNDKIVLFDGVCKLCSSWARFLIKYDKKQKFKLATVQSEEGKELLDRYGLPSNNYETMVYIDGLNMYTQSEAFLKVMRLLPFPWPVLSIGLLIPGFLRNWLYDRVALNRYALFGKYDTCLLPDADHETRFLCGK
ncbi:MAG: putative DCC family thiol-disulfide oxidoreductase YuxK [Halioglobus sp.]|jgi:predicted DCC family thiol-disulfide oxidoreductase YuxK